MHPITSAAPASCRTTSGIRPFSIAYRRLQLGVLKEQADERFDLPFRGAWDGLCFDCGAGATAWRGSRTGRNYAASASSGHREAGYGQLLWHKGCGRLSLAGESNQPRNAEVDHGGEHLHAEVSGPGKDSAPDSETVDGIAARRGGVGADAAGREVFL